MGKGQSFGFATSGGGLPAGAGVALGTGVGAGVNEGEGAGVGDETAAGDAGEEGVGLCAEIAMEKIRLVITRMIITASVELTVIHLDHFMKYPPEPEFALSSFYFRRQADFIRLTL